MAASPFNSRVKITRVHTFALRMSEATVPGAPVPVAGVMAIGLRNVGLHKKAYAHFILSDRGLVNRNPVEYILVRFVLPTLRTYTELQNSNISISKIICIQF